MHVDEAQRAVAGAGSPQQRAHARAELLDRERLHQVVVRARVEPFDPVVDRVARGDDEDRHGVLAAAQRPAHLDAADLGISRSRTITSAGDDACCASASDPSAASETS